MKKILAACAVPVLAAAALVATEGGASAQSIERVDCTDYNYTWVLSNETTCWAYAGSIAVTLYGVDGVNSGNNVGYLASASGYKYFPARYQHYPFSSRTVDLIHIN